MWKLIRPDAEAVLRDKGALSALKRYFGVMQDSKPAKFLILKKIPVKDSSWESHDSALEEFKEIQSKIDSGNLDYDEIPSPSKSLLDLKQELAYNLLSSCCFCERRCGVNRLNGELGRCESGVQPEISSHFMHMGEEPELVPSYTIFFMGCTFKCIFCQNWSISQRMELGNQVSPRQLAKIIESARKQGARNVNFVGGEPTPWLHSILETMNHCSINIPVVWNSNSGYSLETARLLDGFVDIYLLDFKYGPGECSWKLSKFKNYWEIAIRNHRLALQSGELIIRHLVMPNHLECCTYPILEFIADELGRDVRLNLMFQYRPEYKAYEDPTISRRLTKSEIQRALEIAEQVGLRNYIT